MKIRYPKHVPLIAVDKPVVMQKYHVSWGDSRGVVGICIEVNEVNKTVIMKSPKTKVIWKYPVKWSDLRHLRKQQYNIEIVNKKMASRH
jgi:hypothetical protein